MLRVFSSSMKNVAGTLIGIVECVDHFCEYRQLNSNYFSSP